MNDTQHQDLLSINLRMPYKALLSTYDNNLYNTTLESWNKHSFGVGTRKGKAVETVYYNYDLSNGLLHDYSYLGKNCVFVLMVIFLFLRNNTILMIL